MRFSLGISGLVPAVPRKSLYPTHAPSTPAAVHPIIRHPVDLSQNDEKILVLTTLAFITTRHQKVHLRSSFGYLPAQIEVRTSDPTLTTMALYHRSSDWFETRS